MRKIGILTLPNDYNLGGILQNYATQQLLSELGLLPETIPQNNQWSHLFKLKMFYLLGRTDIGALIRPLLKPINKGDDEKALQRKRAFDEFIEDNVVISTFNIESRDNVITNDIRDMNEYFDFFLVGSDQVWNPNFTLLNPNYFLDFASRKKRISFADSFGVSDLPKRTISDYRNYLSNFDDISVRENEGQAIIKKVTNRNATVLLDPTFAITKEKWLSLSREIDIDKPYILTYFLGEIDESIMKGLRSIETQGKYEIVDVANNKQGIGPAEFLGLINGSELFLTDSFHGVVFSIIFGKPFYSFHRTDIHKPMNSRIRTVLERFSLQDKLLLQKDLSWVNKEWIDDGVVSSEIIKHEKKRTIDYLKSQIGVK